MNTTNLYFYKSIKQSVLTVLTFLLSLSAFAQDPDPTVESDSTKTGFSFGNIEMANPNSITSKYTYDPQTDRYVYTESIGNFNINYPIILTPKEYQDLVFKENLKGYYQDKIDAFDGKKENSEEAKKNLLPEFYVNSGFFESIFGGNTIEVVPQGSLEMDLGVLFTKQDNPSFSPRNRSNFTFDFDQRISLSLLGKVGERLQVTANYDTEASFDFQQLVKLEYDPTFGGGEDSILQKLEVGNVSMPLNSSLISGAQSLFGVKTKLQFGKTTVTAVFSEQKSDTRSVVAQGGGTLDEFDFFIRDYDENRHFFLAQYFRENYDKSLENYPFINTNVQITRAEVWVTNRSNRTENVRNIVALQDLGESAVIGNSGVVVTAGPGAFPDNANNRLDPTNIGGPGSQITDAIRDIATVQSGILVSGFNEGFDYAKLENTRKLQEGQEYIINTQLGYISLNQRLNNDEVLAVAFQYTVGGQVFQVGEFANDGIGATTVETNGDNEVTNVTNNNLILKLLKSSITSVSQPIWDLMMKNIYDTGAYQLSQEDFKLNIFYNESTPLNFISPEGGTFGVDINGNPITSNTPLEDYIEKTTLLRLFNLDRLNYNGDPQANGDGFFDFESGITVIPENGKIIFTKVEPFGRYLFDVLDNDGNPGNNAFDYESDVYTTNPNQEKYVYDVLYKATKTAALDEVEKNKFQIKGRYKSQGGDGIAIGGFNVPRGSVKVTAGGRVLVEGVDYTVNYQLGRVQILDEALKASNTPIQVTTENNSIFGQQTKRYTGINVEHQFNDKFLIGATYVNLNERPITQKANYNSEPINNTILGFNGNYSTEVPFFTRLANKLPNIDTDAPSNLSVSGEFAYLMPGAPKGTDLNGEATAYIDDFEGSQNGIDLKSAQSWRLSSRPLGLNGTTANDVDGFENGYDRALLNWYTIDPIFYGGQRPTGIDDDDVSDIYTSRVFVQELFPEQDIAQGQTSVLNTLDLTYYPTERGPYNFSDTNLSSDGNTLITPSNGWAGITRQLTSTDFEQSNVEYIEFWMQDPFQENATNPGGKLVFNLGSISEDVLRDGRKQYENGLPADGNISLLPTTTYNTVVPLNQALIYAFDSTGEERTNQDVGFDGYNDAEEGVNFPAFSGLEDPSADNYQYYLSAEGDVLERYKRYNNVQGNSPDTFSDTNRGSTTQPDVEDINRDNTMNTIDSYFEYELELTRQNLPLNSPDEVVSGNPIGEFIKDVKLRSRELPNGDTEQVRWYQFRVPVQGDHVVAKNGITDLRSIRFARMYLSGFTEQTTFRFGTLDLVRSDWRRYQLALNGGPTSPNFDDTEFTVGVISSQENDGSYESPPGIEPERLNNNNSIIDQNEQSLVVNVCDLEPKDSRAVYKNISVDMRQYKRLRMFMHAEDGDLPGLADKDLVGFIRMGNDLTENYYQIEVPLQVSTGTSSAALWPTVNEIDLPLELLEQIKSLGISNGTLANADATFYDVVNGQPIEIASTSQYENYVLGQTRLAIKGNPNFGAVRTLMVGVKNGSNNAQCGEVWFNELRLSDMDNQGGWAAIMNIDTNFADFANVSATGRMSTAGFGSVDQGPQERSREDVKQYDVVTNVNIGQLLPKKWGVQLPFNYEQGVELITPEYDEQYKDLKLQNRIDAAETAEEKDNIREQSEEYTKRRSINFIGVKKIRTGESKPSFYDVENLTFNHSYNKVEHRDFEIERSIDKQVRTGASYAFNFQPKVFEPFKKKDSLFTGKYWKLLKDFNLNLLPSSIAINSDIKRQFNSQRFREVELGGNNIGLEELYKRNYNFDFQSTVNWNLTKSLSFNFAVANNNIVRNYFKDNIVNGEQDSSLDVWDGYFDVGDANRRSQTLGINYEIPFSKFPALDFVKATYSYQGLYQWQKGSDLFGDLVADDGVTYDLGNSISNGNTHNINSTLDMRKFYKYIGLKKKRVTKSNGKVSRNAKAGPPGIPNKEEGKNKAEAKKKSGVGTGIANFGIGILTSVKRIQANYSENNGTYLPGFTDTPGFISTSKPTFGYTLGSQKDIRDVAARNGWLTVFPDFNQQYTKNHTKQLDLSANLEPLNDLKIDLVATRTYAENYTENYRIENDEYISLTPNVFGNFNVSTFTLPTAFGNSDEISSEAFDTFRENRLTIARRLAAEKGVDLSNQDNFEGADLNGYPKGFGKTSQAVLLPAFLSAYTGQNAEKTKLGAFRNVPIPNWDLKYTGLMKFKWFKQRFKRLSLSHGYRSSYTINQFRTNLDFNGIDYSAPYDFQPSDDLDQAGNYKNSELYSNINLTELFSPLIKVDMEMKNSIIVGAEIRKDRLLSLSFDNNLMTEIQGKEYALKLGYRFKDVRIKTKLAGPKKSIVSDLLMEANLSVRDNKTIIRYLDLENNQITNGQTIYGLKYNANYAFSQNLTGIFYFDYTFSEYAISTAFPQTTIRSGFTLRYNFGN